MGDAAAAGGVRVPDGFTLIALDACGSTNDEAKERARNGAPDRTVVWARTQTAGRGRRGRAWSSPQGNLFASIVLRPGLPPGDAALVSFVAAVALGETVDGLVSGAVRLKWPNDVLVGDAKLSGILLESERGEGDAVDWLVLGIGVNVAAFPEGLDYPATSLRAAGADVSVEAVLERLLSSFDAWYGRWLTQGFAPVRAAWLNAARGFGTPLTVRLADGAIRGLFADLDMQGALVLETPDGRRHVTAGDVFFG